MPSSLERLRGLESKATPGPWARLTHGTASQRDAAMRAALAVMAVRAPDNPDIEYTDLSWVESADPAGPHIALVGNGPTSVENAAFIVAAVEYVRELLAATPASDGLDEAWKAAEAALPEGAWLHLWRRAGYVAEAYFAAADPRPHETGRGPTPAAALRALAARLTPSEGGE